MSVLRRQAQFTQDSKIMRRIFSILHDGTEYRLPVTPASIRLDTGIKIDTAAVYGLGDINLAGDRTAAAVSISSFFPAQAYDFCIGQHRDPYDWVKIFKKIIKKKKPVRLIISDTAINIRVLIKSIEYGEDPGTNDINYTLTLVEYRRGMAAEPRPQEDTPYTPETYTVVYGDTLWSIARRFYGDGKFYKKIAAANGIQDPNVLAVGQVLRLPKD